MEIRLYEMNFLPYFFCNTSKAETMEKDLPKVSFNELNYYHNNLYNLNFI